MNTYCPHCGLIAPPYGVKCRNCGGWINPLPVPIGKHGNCPTCHSPSVELEREYEHHNRGCLASATAASLVLIGLPFILVGIGWFLVAAGVVVWIVASVLPNKRLVGTTRKCLRCGHAWRV